jgi:hypothetical protein
MEFRAKQIAPPKSWERFEDLCHALFKKVWTDPIAQKEGRRGQPQYGVDIVGSPNSERGRFYGVQCKGKDANYGSSASWDEILAEVSKAEHFSPTLEHWIFATTAPVDGKLQRAARELSVERLKTGLFTVSVLGWEEIQALMAEAPSVIEEFYPEAAFDLPGLLRELRELVNQAPNQSILNETESATSRSYSTQHPDAVWQAVTFNKCRDLGPALMGRPLGPADAAVCPKLYEVDALIGQLQTAFSTRIFGVPGAGKSVCAYQAARLLSEQGFLIKRLLDPEARVVNLDQHISTNRVLYLIDDAHLMTPSVLNQLEDLANANVLLLSIHNAVEHQSVTRGAIILDPERAVKTIAKDLRVNRASTLKAVRRSDNQIGEHMMDLSLDHRIDEAEAKSKFPWQFCFILGGGWQRAKYAADAAKMVKADFVLAALSVRQIVSRDAMANEDDVSFLCKANGLNPSVVTSSLAWLARERYILSLQDCRTPHQRFAAVVLHQILINRNEQGRCEVFRLIESILCDSTYPLAGIRNLLHELRSGYGNYRWSLMKPFQMTTIQRLSDRCWQAGNDDDRNFGCLVLNELDGFIEDWTKILIEPKKTLLAEWLTVPGRAGYGLGTLLNSMHQSDENLRRTIVTMIVPEKLGTEFSNATIETAYGISQLLRSAYCRELPEWTSRLLSSIDQNKMKSISKEWTTADKAFLFAYVCQTVSYYNDSLALEMLEEYIPTARRILSADPFDGFHSLDDIAMGVLHVFDPLGIYVGKLKPDARRWKIARQMCSTVDTEQLAAQISEVPLRQFQHAAFFLSFFFKSAPSKVGPVVNKLDWERIAATIGDDWVNPSHEVEVFIGVLCAGKSECSAVTNFITLNAERIRQFPPRFVFIAPEVAIQHVADGREIRLVQHVHVAWDYGMFVIELFAEERPDLLHIVLRPHEEGIAKGLSGQNSSWFSNAGAFLNSMNKHAPDVLQSILTKVNVAEASKGWIDSLVHGGSARSSVAILVDAAMGQSGDIGELARSLRQRFPAASVPKGTPKPFARRRARSRRSKG